MASPVLGIDLGTTNSVVAYADQNRVRVLRDEAGSLLTPSTVSFHPSGQILVGASARERRLVDAENTVFSIKRLIGRPFRSPEVRRAADRFPFKLEEGATGGVMVQARGETYSLPEISSFVLRELRRIAEQALGQSCVNAVVTVPANFNELQRMATRDAGRIAGLNVLRILNEPTAAALAYGYRANSNQRIAVYDLGGGTFDISILELSGDVIEVIATAGDTYLGGDDVDRLIADRMVAEFLAKHRIDVSQDPQVYERVCMAAEWIKCQLSLLESAEATVQEVAYASGGQPMDLVFRISRSDLDQMIFNLIGRTFDICEDAMRLAGVRPSQLDGVILVGGQTRTPKVRDMVGEYFGMAPQSSVDPDLVVAQGAALQGFALAGNRADARKTLSGTPTPRSDRPEPTLEYAKPAALSARGAGSGFDDQPTTIANRVPVTPFDDLPTTVADRPTDEITAPDAMAGMKSTLTGVGSRAAPLPPLAAGQLPKPPPLSEVLDAARQTSAAQNATAELPQPPTRTLAETPGAKAGVRPSGFPSRAPSAASPSMPPAPRVPSELAAFPLVMDEVTQEDLPPALKQVMREPSPIPPRPVTSTLAETPKAKAAQRASMAPPPVPSAPPPSPAKPSVATQKPIVSQAPSPAARVSQPPVAAPVAAPAASEEPIRTQSMARLLAAQGHKDRALAIYDELIAKAPGDSKLSREADTLRRASFPAAKPVSQAPVAPSVSAPPPPAAKPVTTAPAAPAVIETPAPAALATPVPPVATTQSQFPAPARANSQLLLLDVTPHTLSVETAGGFCEQVIERNAAIPTEQTRIFSTSQDNQVVVSMRISQGEARRTDENQVLGQVELMGLRAARRGEVSIAVTFIIDADGTLHVKAQDRATGHAQAIRVSLVGAIDDGDIDRMRGRQSRKKK